MPNFIETFASGEQHWHFDDGLFDVPEDFEEFGGTMIACAEVWVFCGEDAHFPGAVFSSEEKGMAWIEIRGLRSELRPCTSGDRCRTTSCPE